MAANDRPVDEHKAWITRVREEPLEPQLPILDPHHHLWLDAGHTGWPYTLSDLHNDTGSGHNVQRTVFLECHAECHAQSPDRPPRSTPSQHCLNNRSLASRQRKRER